MLIFLLSMPRVINMVVKMLKEIDSQEQSYQWMSDFNKFLEDREK